MPSYEVDVSLHARVVVQGVESEEEAIERAEDEFRVNGNFEVNRVVEIPDADLSHHKRHADIII